MTTIKLKISTEVETEHEIEIGSYYKNICFFWKVLSEERAIAVYKSDHTGKCGIEIMDTSSVFRPSLGAVPCEEKEFEDAFFETNYKISTAAGLK